MSTTPVRPPVNEVVISASFEPQAVLDGPRLMVGMSDILAEFPDVTEMPPYEMAAELPTAEQVLQPAVPQIQFICAPKMQRRRLWFTKTDEPALLVQAQSNYLALNWRRQDDEIEYPEFEDLLDRFSRYLSIVETACIRSGGQRLSLSQIEITYINILKPDGAWGSFRDINHVVAVQVPDMEKFEHFNLGYAQAIEDSESGAFLGRVHVAVSTAYQPKIIAGNELHPLSVRDMSPVLNLSITARSGKLSELVDTISPRFELAYSAVECAFRKITTEAARQTWGLA
ncbi:MAG: TIGR04255 family protein [Pseudonocardiales bacterium]|nr:TIGR04255 family protein [Pseudonocardiales bacterium]